MVVVAVVVVVAARGKKLDQYSDKWPQCDKTEYDTYDIRKPSPHLVANEPAATFYARAMFHRMLLEKKILLRVLVYPMNDALKMINIRQAPKA